MSAALHRTEGAEEDVSALVAQLLGRAAYLRGKGSVKTAGLLEQAAEALSAPSGWQPIETAPKANRDIFVVQAFDVTDLNCGVRRYTSDPYCVWPGYTGGWVRWPHPFRPTHWVKLPAPPVPNQGEAS